MYKKKQKKNKNDPRELGRENKTLPRFNVNIKRRKKHKAHTHSIELENLK